MPLQTIACRLRLESMYARHGFGAATRSVESPRETGFEYRISIIENMEEDERDEDAPAAKRPKSLQDDVIERTLAEDEALKRARKAEKGGGEPKSRGKTLQEIEVGATWCSMVAIWDRYVHNLSRQR